MYRNSEFQKQDQLRSAVRTQEYSTQVEEKSFDDLLLKESIVKDSKLSMPSDTTLEYTDYKGQVDSFAESLVVTKEKYSISSRGKALIALYAFLLISIFAFIIFNAAYLRGLDRKIQKAQGEVASLEEVVYEKEIELQNAKNIENILKKAVEDFGMEIR